MHIFDTYLADVSKVKLCDLVTCHDNRRIPMNLQERIYKKGIYPYYGANGIQDYVDNYIFDGEYILLAEDGGHFNDFNQYSIAQYVLGKIWVNNHAHILEVKSCNAKFLFYMLEHKDIRSFINGTSRAKLNQDDMLQITIPLPTIERQTKISRVLNNIDLLIYNAENTSQNLSLYKIGLLQRLFI